MKFVATKTADQLDLQAVHRVRERLVSQRTGIISIKFAPSCWSAVSRFGKGNGHCGQSCLASWPTARYAVAPLAAWWRSVPPAQCQRGARTVAPTVLTRGRNWSPTQRGSLTAAKRVRGRLVIG